MNYSRKSFLKLVGTGSLLAGTQLFQGSNATAAKPEHKKLKLGVASYSLRKHSVEEVIEIANRLELKAIALKSMHLAMDSSESEIKAVAEKFTKAGLDLYGAGVIYMKSAEEVENAFRYAEAAQLRTIIGVPNHDLLGLVEKKVKETHIQVAIHNHGPGDKVYPSPETVYEKVKNLDPRVGLCIDIGHTIRIGLDPARDIEKYADRLFDVHLKDVDVAAARGKSIELGRGVIDLPSVIQALNKINYNGIMALEFEKDADDVMPGLAESVGYVRGLLDAV